MNEHSGHGQEPGSNPDHGQQGQPEGYGYGQPPAGAGGYGQPQYGAGQYGQSGGYGYGWQYGAPYGQQPYGAGQYGPGSGYGPGKPSNNLVWAILATILCCLPSGVVSIVYAAKVDSLWAQGAHAQAHDASRKALIWAGVSLGLGILAFIFGMGLGLLEGASSGYNSEY